MSLKLEIAYNGASYSGWQRQKNSVTVQEALEKAIEEIMGYHIPTTAAGRTDAGVHARQMPVSLDLNAKQIPLSKLPKAINSRLPYDIRVLSASEISGAFNARFDAKSRSYEYILLNERDVFRNETAAYVYYPIDFELISDSAEIYIGSHDFTTFSKNNPDTKNPVCKVTESRWDKISDSEFHYHITADRFIYGMVRSLVGSMIDLARGKRTKQELLAALQLKDRRHNSPLAPAEGLYFIGAEY